MFALMELYEANLSDITCKHEDRVCSFSEEDREPSSAIYGYYINELDVEIEVINFAEAKKQQEQRIKRYIDVLGRGIAS